MRRCFEVSSGAWALFATLASALILVVAVFPALPIGGEMLDVRGGYSYPETLAALEEYGEAGRRAYAWASLTLDTLLPVLYAGFLAGLIHRFRPSERWWKLAWMPLAAGAIDLCENVQIVVMLNRYPDISPGQVAVASLFTSLKGFAFLICLALAIALAVVAAGRRLRAGIRDRAA